MTRLTIFLALTLAIATPQSPSTLDFWRNTVKAPLTGPMADQLFVDTYKDTLIPPGKSSYFEAQVVGVVDSQGSKLVLLSMEGNGYADVALQCDSPEWKLLADPSAGSVVRFRGVVRNFAKQPFMVLMDPAQVSGLALFAPKSYQLL